MTMNRLTFILALLLSASLLASAAPQEAAARKSKSKIEYTNFDPNGRLRVLEREAQLAAAKAAAMKNPISRDMIIRIILRVSAEQGLDRALLLAMAKAESRLDPYAESPAGAQGVMQLMPETAKMFGCKNPFDVYQNVHGAGRYLTFLLKRYDGNVRLAVAAYNSGPAPVDRLRNVPPIGETQKYVAKVLRYIDEIRLELP
jgi:soluble lytic murein transglycosylase-like protein